jgi:hypothetical protein
MPTDRPDRDNLWRVLLILSTLAVSWLAMQIVHEVGHVIAACSSGGQVVHVELKPWTLSRTDVSPNPSPLLVAWGGPIVGVLLPLIGWWVAHRLRIRIRYLLRFFAGFCLIANGAYIGAGMFVPVGDAAEMLKSAAMRWPLLLFGLLTIPAGLALWHRQGADFGLGPHPHAVRRGDAIGCAALLAAIVVTETLL